MKLKSRVIKHTEKMQLKRSSHEETTSLFDELEERSLHHYTKTSEQEYRSRVILLFVTIVLSITFVMYHETNMRHAITNLMVLDLKESSNSYHTFYPRKNDEEDGDGYLLNKRFHETLDTNTLTGVELNEYIKEFNTDSSYNKTKSIIEEKMSTSFVLSSNDERNLSAIKSLEEIKHRIQETFQKYEQQMHLDYGEYTFAFQRSNIMKSIFISPSNLSYERFKRRLKIKILQSYLQSSNDCDTDDKNKVTFTWVVGGHSAAAGHGNLLKQAYAAVLERTVSPFFNTLGITFRAKNYAMGGTNSGPEIAMCINSLFGLDIDALSWDYGMMDTYTNWYYALWAERVGVHPTTPILFTNGIHGHKDINYEFERKGLGTFFIDKDISWKLSQFPDSLDPNISVSKLPPLVKYYLCNGHIEKEEPCKQNKWHTEECLPKTVSYQSSWHNGWKDHQFYGNLLSAFVIYNIIDSIDEMLPDSLESSSRRRLGHHIGMKPQLSHEYLDYLLSLEKKDKNKFLSSDLTKNIGLNGYPGHIGPDIYSHFQRGNAICHSSILPNQARYDGLVTESGIKSEYLGGGRTTYGNDEGYSSTNIPEPVPDDPSITPYLVYDSKTRDICDLAEIDFKDYFSVREKDRWMTLMVPNDSEYDVFGKLGTKPVGLVMMCTIYCNWNRCPKDYVNIRELVSPSTDDYGVMVNGIKATGVTDIDQSGQQRCQVLKNENGYFFPTSPPDGSLKDEEGRFNIKISVEKKDGQLYLSSIIVI